MELKTEYTELLTRLPEVENINCDPYQNMTLVLVGMEIF